MIPIIGAILPKIGAYESYGYNRGKRPNGDDHIHNGIDLPAPLGTPVYAAEGGIVTNAIRQFTPGFGGYGKVVVVKSDNRNVWFLYAHLSEVLVNVGDRVSSGDTIGRVGSTAYTAENRTRITGANHLHFETLPSAYDVSLAYKQPRLNPIAVLLTTPAAKAAGAGILVLLGLGALGWYLVKKKKRRLS